MFTTKKYRAKSKEYGELINGSDDPSQIRKLQDSKDSFSSLADNEEWLSDNYDKMVHAPGKEQLPDNAIVVARSMGPAALLDYDRKKLRGLILEEGGPTSHVSIVAMT